MSGLIDTEFMDGDEPAKKPDADPDGRFYFDDEGKGIKVSDAPEPVELDWSKPPEKNDDIEVKIVDDTPEPDKGRRVADLEGSKAVKDKHDLELDDEVKQYSKDVQKRIKTLTARSHEYRRAAEDRERQLIESANIAKRLLAENNQLKGVLEGGEKALLQEHKGRLEAQIKQAKNAYREAHEAGDVNGMLAAQEEIARSVSQLERNVSYQPQVLAREKEEDLLKPLNIPQPRPQVTDAATEWQERNRWFGEAGNELMSSYAMAVHQQIVAEGKVQPDTKEYFARIDDEVRKRFPEKFSQPQRRQATPVVAAPSRQNSGERKVVQLTESQVRLARRLGLTNEQYARQVAKEQGLSNG